MPGGMMPSTSYTVTRVVDPSRVNRLNPMGINFNDACKCCHGTGTIYKNGFERPCKKCYKQRGFCTKCYGTKINFKKGTVCTSCD